MDAILWRQMPPLLRVLSLRQQQVRFSMQSEQRHGLQVLRQPR
jgi:hypothetical protein